MIKFNSKDKIITLGNKDFSYVIYVNEIGVLQKLYFGKPINDFTDKEINWTTNLDYEKYSFFDTKNGNEVYPTKHFYSELCSLNEIPTYQRADKRSPLIKVEHADGSYVTDFRYVSHEIIKGKTEPKGMPCFKAKETEAETLCITLKDVKDEIYLKAYYTVYDNLPVVIRHNEIINKSAKTVYLTKFSSICLDLPTDEYSVLYVHGMYAFDRQLEEIPIKHNTVLIDDNSGFKGFKHNPVGMLKANGTTETAGEAIGFGLVYSTNFSISISGDQLDTARVVVGLNDENFKWNLNPGDSFESPEAFLTYSSLGTDYVTNTFHDLIRSHILRNTDHLPQDTIILNSWESTYFNIDTEKIILYISKAKEMGVNMFVMDDGWFGQRDDDLRSLGDWYVNEKKINLKKVIDHAHSLGMRFGLWVEPEMISPDSDLYRAHPEYALYDRGVVPTTLRHQLVLDLTNPEVIDYISDRLKDIFSTYAIDYCKWDCNRIISEPHSSYLKPDQQGEIYHRCILGTYELLRRFTSQFPNILLETCCSGGGRFDLGMLYYSSQIWGSDETDGVPRTMIQYATNMFYPLRTIGSHVSSRKLLSIKEKAAIAIFGTFGYELNPLLLKEQDMEEVKIANKWFLDNKNIIDNGDYYGLINPFNNGNYVSWEVVGKDKNQVIVFFMNYKLRNWNSQFLKLKGLNPNIKYKNSYDNLTHYGDFYMNVGLNLSAGVGNLTPQLFFLTAENEN